MISLPLMSFAEGSGFWSYWHGFMKYWGDFFGRQNGVVMIALVVAAVSIFIITRGKWRK